MSRDFVAEAHREVIPNIGQIDEASKRLLEREVRAGRLAKWRGAWHPPAGAPYGMLPFKTCYGTPEMKAFWAGVAEAFDRAPRGATADKSC